jgi:hypothetical protein
MKRDEVGRLAQRLGGPVARDVRQQARQAAGARLGHVEMGIGAEDRDGGGELDHRLGDIRVQVEADRDGQVGADLCFADEPQERALAVEIRSVIIAPCRSR